MRVVTSKLDHRWKRYFIAEWFVTIGVVAIAMRQWKGRVRESEQRAVDAERGREEAARRRAAEERLRIARELHDSLTHSISVIKVQSGVAAHLARKRGEEVSDAILAIQEASSDAVRELRATLEVLREESATPGNGIERIPSLVERTRSVGLTSTVRISGKPRTVPNDIDKAAYRIVQEALTNVTRHAEASTATVELAYDTGLLTVSIDDDGIGAPDADPSPGLGLVGMRERVTALGGKLSTANRVDGGFRVCAEIPVPVST
ncbi:sensor histidine kinase [Nocardioidaceae bacterium SCSIO 66511]|nr:sensor histidine kinase [Nocardioidaceae bacterium SCSIO 66511]